MATENERYISNYSAETIEQLLKVQSGESDIGEQLKSLQKTIAEVSELKTKINSQIQSLEEDLKTLEDLQSKINDAYTTASQAKETADEAKETADGAKETASNNSTTIVDLRGSFTTWTTSFAGQIGTINNRFKDYTGTSDLPSLISTYGYATEVSVGNRFKNYTETNNLRTLIDKFGYATETGVTTKLKSYLQASDSDTIKNITDKFGYATTSDVDTKLESYLTQDDAKNLYLTQDDLPSTNSLYSDHGEPGSDLGENGDTYIDLDTWNTYLKVNGEWKLQGNIKGSSGDNGSTIYTEHLNGESPLENFGNNGDLCIDLDTDDMWVKTGDTWEKGANIKGEQGLTGATGATGAIGPTGAAGSNGAAGGLYVPIILYLSSCTLYLNIPLSTDKLTTNFKTILDLIQQFFKVSGQPQAPQALFDLLDNLGYITTSATYFKGSYLTISGGISTEIMYTAIAAFDKEKYLVYSAPSTYTLLSIASAPVLNLNEKQIEQMFNYIGNNF